MSGGTSTLWRTSLCGVVMALAVLGTGCAIETASDSDEDTAETQADLTLILPKVVGGLQTPKGAVSGPYIPNPIAQTKSPVSHFTEFAEPEPDPWTNARDKNSDGSDQPGVTTATDHADDHQ
jgi:hypothetical protein